MNRPILTLDFETDPFEFKQRVLPFACGVYDGKDFVSFWGADCPAKVVAYLSKQPPSIVYMHNGGRFDIFFLIQQLEKMMLIINGRIVKANLGHHEIRDSYSIIPVALSQYKKDDIDITKLHSDCRATNKQEILSYLRGDCVYLYELVTAFRDEFGDYLTIGSAAMNELRKIHPFPKGNSYNDEKFRENFFRGGRVQCFQPGEQSKPFKIFDVNSMYPDVMKNFRHPNGSDYEVTLKVGKNTAFIICEGRNYGAFMSQDKKGGLDFTSESGRYYCTIHEWIAALETGMFKPTKVIKCYDYEDWISFDGFVDHFFAGRAKAKAAGDKLHDLFYKLILNSAYGKFAQDPIRFADNALTNGEYMVAPWVLKYSHNFAEWLMWEKPVDRHSYFNVSIGASITGAARSVLMRGINAATDLIYCDTDSLICRDLPGVELSETKLGAWKLEGQGNRVAIAGKKMYACFDDTIIGPVSKDDPNGNNLHCIKKATKGARLSADEIARCADGEVITFQKAAPTFKLDGSIQFIERKIRRTV